MGLNYWEINENYALQNIKNIVTSKFKEKMWCEKDLVAKRKLNYYKKVINPTLEDQKYLSILTSSKKKINIARIRMSFHELHSETGHWQFLKHHGWKGSAIYVRIGTLRMKTTSS